MDSTRDNIDEEVIEVDKLDECNISAAEGIQEKYQKAWMELSHTRNGINLK